jgi:hypothetical protein
MYRLRDASFYEVRFQRRLLCNILSPFVGGFRPQDSRETHAGRRHAIFRSHPDAGRINVCSRQGSAARGFPYVGELLPVSAHRQQSADAANENHVPEHGII